MAARLKADKMIQEAQSGGPLSLPADKDVLMQRCRVIHDDHALYSYVYTQMPHPIFHLCLGTDAATAAEVKRSVVSESRSIVAKKAAKAQVRAWHPEEDKHLLAHIKPCMGPSDWRQLVCSLNKLNTQANRLPRLVGNVQKHVKRCGLVHASDLPSREVHAASKWLNELMSGLEAPTEWSAIWELAKKGFIGERAQDPAAMRTHRARLRRLFLKQAATREPLTTPAAGKAAMQGGASANNGTGARREDDGGTAEDAVSETDTQPAFCVAPAPTTQPSTRHNSEHQHANVAEEVAAAAVGAAAGCSSDNAPGSAA